MANPDAPLCPACYGTVLFRWDRMLRRRRDGSGTKKYRKAYVWALNRRASRFPSPWYTRLGVLVTPRPRAKSSGPSPHLSWKELRCRGCGIVYPTEWRKTRGKDLGMEFEAIRALCGNVPLRVTSGYRCRGCNIRLTGAATNSQHLHGRAMDLACPPHLSYAEFFGLIVSRAYTPESRIRGIGRYTADGHVHVDVRPTSRLVRWGT